MESTARIGNQKKQGQIPLRELSSLKVNQVRLSGGALELSSSCFYNLGQTLLPSFLPTTTAWDGHRFP